MGKSIFKNDFLVVFEAAFFFFFGQTLTSALTESLRYRTLCLSLIVRDQQDVVALQVKVSQQLVMTTMSIIPHHPTKESVM